MTIEQIEAFKNGYNNGFITNEIRDAFWLSIDSLMAHNAMLCEALGKLLAAKNIKQQHGKTPEYEELKETGWYLAATSYTATEADTIAYLTAYVERVMGWKSQPGQDLTDLKETFSKKAVEAYLGPGPYAEACKQLAIAANERDCALAHVAMLVERLSRLKNILCAPFFVTKQEKSSGWHSTYSSLMNDIDGLIAATAPSTNLLLQRLEQFARLDIINLVAREYQNCDSAEALVAKLQLLVQQNTNVEGNKQC